MSHPARGTKKRCPRCHKVRRFRGHKESDRRHGPAWSLGEDGRLFCYVCAENEVTDLCSHPILVDERDLLSNPEDPDWTRSCAFCPMTVNRTTEVLRPLREDIRARHRPAAWSHGASWDLER